MQQGNLAVRPVMLEEAVVEADLIDVRSPAERIRPLSVAPEPATTKPHPGLTDEDFSLTFHARVAEAQREADLIFIPDQHPGFRAAKRALDLLIAIPALIVLAPVMAAIVVAIRLDSPGKAFFTHLRAGEGGHLIRFHKFRTMYVDSKERFPDMFRYDFAPGALDEVFYKPQDDLADPRVTRLGRFLRRTSLDELPNLFDVVAGRLSIVGPRPELLGVLRYYRPEQMAKFSVKPGMTGLAACSGRNNLTVEEQIRFDLEYVAKQSLGLDIRIIAMTAREVVAMRGAA